MDWLFATVAALIATLIFIGLIVQFNSLRWALAGLLILAGGYTYFDERPTRYHAEKPPEARKLKETEKPSKTEKPFEDSAFTTARLAAEQGRDEAQFTVGRMYEEAQGVPQYFAEATRWYRLAADQGHAGAQLRLGLMYREGRGVPHDFVKSYMWLNIAASRFSATETESRDRAIQNRDRAASRLTVGQLAEAQRLAREWKPKPTVQEVGLSRTSSR
jgi:TPR repeat protein